ncbi:MAG TPA: rhodanese-like domain-containing protein [Nocardioidaceae bacterium]|nr:rhodanese-like domain-containing protein [Nocardioidaceae bacterium]
MKSLRRVLAALSVVVLVLGITSCDSTSEASGTVVRVQPARAVELIRQGDDTVIDLRTPREYEAGHVAGAINIDSTAPDFEERVKELDSSMTYLVYASNKTQSAPAADTMVRLGIDRVLDAGGFGLLALSGAGLE